MTKKDYELFANEIHNKFNDGELVDSKIMMCIKLFKQDNTLFQADKFERACYEGKHIRKSIKQA